MTDVTLYDHRSSICSQMARLALVEKSVPYARREVDIMETQEQFAPWYVALNSRAVVPTLTVGTEVFTDTIRIVERVQKMPGPDLSGDHSTTAWLHSIMALHYGVLLYRNRLNADGTAPQMQERGRLLKRLALDRPNLRPMLQARLDGNLRFQKLLRDPQAVEVYVDEAQALVTRLAAALSGQAFLAGDSYSLADCFATATLARLTIHRLDTWWQGGPLEAYYDRMKARPSFVAAEVIDTGTERDL